MQRDFFTRQLLKNTTPSHHPPNPPFFKIWDSRTNKSKNIKQNKRTNKPKIVKYKIR